MDQLNVNAAQIKAVSELDSNALCCLFTTLFAMAHKMPEHTRNV